MSAYKKIKCKIKNLNHLETAVKNLGMDLIKKDSKIPLMGYKNDYRPESAEIIIPKTEVNKLSTGASNDIGFFFDDETNEWNMYCSEYDTNLGIADKIRQEYTKIAINEALNKFKFKITEETKKGKVITIKASKLI